jgi:hypothetical protein
MSNHQTQASSSVSIDQNVCGTVYAVDFSRYDRLFNRPMPVPPDVIEKVRFGIAKHLSPGGELLNLYVWGSRFYMNHTTKSDYDLVAIVTGTFVSVNFIFFPPRHAKTSPRMIHCSSYCTSIMLYSTYCIISFRFRPF